MKAFIQRAFPVPRVLIPYRVSIEISDGRLHFFEFSQSRGVLYPKTYGNIPFPRVRMSTLNEQIRAESVKVLTSFAEKYKYSSARIIIHEGEVYVFRISVPTIEHSQIRSAVEGLLEENVPISPSEAVFEYSIVKTDVERGETIVAVSVVSEKTLLSLVEIFTEAGIKPAAFETEARALSRSLFTENDKKVHAVLAVNDHHSTVFIVQDGAVSFSSSIEVGSYDIESAVAKTFSLSPEGARDMIYDKAFSTGSEDTKLFDAMIPALSVIRDELGKVLAYWKMQGKKEREFEDISDIVLTGPYSLISGFSKYFSISTKLPTVHASVWTRTVNPQKYLPDLSYRDSLDYGAVIGALL